MIHFLKFWMPVPSETRSIYFSSICNSYDIFLHVYSVLLNLKAKIKINYYHNVQSAWRWWWRRWPGGVPQLSIILSARIFPSLAAGNFSRSSFHRNIMIVPRMMIHDQHSIKIIWKWWRMKMAWLSTMIIISQIYSTEIGKIQQKYLYDHYWCNAFLQLQFVDIA